MNADRIIPCNTPKHEIKNNIFSEVGGILLQTMKV